MRIVSMYVGQPRTVLAGQRSVTTSIWKARAAGPRHLGSLNLEGDAQADLTVHVGVDKAVYAYGLDAYARWEKSEGRSLQPAVFGENLLLDEFDESRVFVGDVFQLGTATVQATQPRLPCYKLGLRFGDPLVLRRFMSMGRPGVYFRVLQEGTLLEGDELKFVQRESIHLSVLELFSFERLLEDPARIRQVLQLRSLPETWRHHFNLGEAT